MSWDTFIAQETEKPYMQKIKAKLAEEADLGNQIYPPADQVLRVFKELPIDQAKVIILAQDPYHGENQANGLAFSVNSGVRLPPSLKNIFKEIESDVGITCQADGDLTRWVRQGVFLLNSTLTVRAGVANSHQKYGWETFTDRAIEELNSDMSPKVFLLWGAFAKKKTHLITNENHLVLTAAHPSPLSAHKGFFGCKHFSQANEYLVDCGAGAIDWS